MKKALILAVMISTGVLFVPPAAQAKAAASYARGGVYAAASEVQPRRYRRYSNRRVRSYIRTRYVRIGYRRYRETYRVTYYPNGRRRVQVLRRVRIR